MKTALWWRLGCEVCGGWVGSMGSHAERGNQKTRRPEDQKTSTRSHALRGNWNYIITKEKMGRSRYKITIQDQPHFVTCTVLHWLPVFTKKETVQIVLDSLTFLQEQGLQIYAWVVLENHLHLVAQSDNLTRDLARFRSYSARQLIDFMKENKVSTLLDQFAYYKKAHKKDSQYQLWQEGVHPELIQGDEMMRQKIAYIHNNPVKRGYVDKVEHWRYSSARSYLGEIGLLDVSLEW